MNRSDFLKRLGIGVAAIVVAPKMITEAKTEENNLDVITCIQDQLKDAGEFKPSVIITDLPIEFNEKKYAILYSNGNPVVSLHNFVAEINSGYTTYYRLAPIVDFKKGVFKGETRADIFGLVNTELYLKFFYDDKTVIEGNVYIEEIKVDMPLNERPCFELEMSLSGPLTINNI